jgi:hypothetical protein
MQDDEVTDDLKIAKIVPVYKSDDKKLFQTTAQSQYYQHSLKYLKD